MKIKKLMLFSLIAIMAILSCFALSACDKTDDSSTYKLEFYLDGNYFTSVKFNETDEIALPEAPELDGLIFDDWYFDDGVWEKPLISEDAIKEILAGNDKVYARYVTNGGISYDIDLTAIKETDTITPELFSAKCRLETGEDASISILKIDGTVSAGSTVSVTMIATIDDEECARVKINGIKVYGKPTIVCTADNGIWSGKQTPLSDLFVARDSFGEPLSVLTKSIGAWENGKNIGVKITAKDKTGNITILEKTLLCQKMMSIMGNGFSDYMIVTDYGNDANIAAACPDATAFARKLKDEYDINIPVYDITAAPTGNKIIIRLTSNAGSYGFSAKIDGNNLIIECSYWNKFKSGFEAFCDQEIFGNKDAIFTASYSYTGYNASIVKYSEFGAKADGVTNDFTAMYQAHEFANQCGQKVVADGASYYIGDTKIGGVIKEISIKTDVDWGNAKIIIDDAFEGAKDYMYNEIFVVEGNTPQEKLGADDIKALNNGTMPTVNRATASLGFLSGKLQGDAIVNLRNNQKKPLDYIRWGNGVETGSYRIEMLLVHKDGAIDSTTPVIFEYEYLSGVWITRADDKEITITGGQFVNICCKSTKNVYNGWHRGLKITRSNVIIRNLDHKMQDEPYRDPANDTKDQSYPYLGFIYQKDCYNVRMYDCDLTGHKTYYKYDGNANTRSGMGTYDLSLEGSIGSYFENITQSEVEIYDNKYWGIMGSNYARNITFKNCKLSRFDAHKGFWNADLIDCEFGQSINVIGGGTLNIINCIRTTGSDFVTLRGDYGGTFEGTANIKNCTLMGTTGWDSYSGTAFDTSSKVNEGYVFNPTLSYNQTITVNKYDSKGNKIGTQKVHSYEWDFGYVCYMPQNIIIDNFKSYATSTYLFYSLNPELFVKQAICSTYGLNGIANEDTTYQLPKSVVYRNMGAKLPVCSAAAYVTWDNSIDAVTRVES